MIRVVVDTNVLVSAMISSDGNEALLMLAINHGLVIPCFCADILREYGNVLSRPKFGFSQSEVQSLIELLQQRGLELGSIAITRISPDPEDDKFIACALAAKAKFLVTGNKRHFLQDRLPATVVVTAGQLMEHITSDF